MNIEYTNEQLELRTCGPINTQFKDEAYNLNEIGVLEDQITNNEIDILLLIVSEAYSKKSEIAEISFQGIKTKLKIHQQKIATALKRLMEKGMIKKTLNGYSLDKKGLLIIDKILKSDVCLRNNSTDYAGLEISILLNNKNNNLFKSIYLLKGRWFSHWRWVGMFTSADSLKMEWESLSNELEICLCINEYKMCIAIFNKSPDPLNYNIRFLEHEFNEFLIKVQDIINFKFSDGNSISKIKIIKPSNCDKFELSNWISNYT